MIKEGFEPIVGKTAKVLILGTFPSIESLKQQQYYAHPRNAFWEMIAAICGTEKSGDYEIRCEFARNAGIAIWDVLKSCDREGSADERIKRESLIVNNITGFLSQHPVKVIFFNGMKAAQLFKRYVDPVQLPIQPQLAILPSTSPAHAALSKRQKLERWLDVKTHLK